MERFPAINLRRPNHGASVPNGMDEQGASVVLIEDHPEMRKALADSIGAHGGLRLVGEAGGGRRGLDLIRSLEPDLAAVDIGLDDLDGWRVLEAAREEQLASRIVFLSGVKDGAAVKRALDGGATGFISKGLAGAEICALLMRAATGKTTVSNDLQDLLIAFTHDDGAALTVRELEVLRCLATDKTAREIGVALHISEATVSGHVARLKAKLGVRSSAGAVAEGFRRRLID